MEFAKTLNASMKAGNGYKNLLKHPSPSSVEERDAIIRKLDQCQKLESCREEQMEKKVFVTASYLLSNHYKNQIFLARAKNLKLYNRQIAKNKSIKVRLSFDSDMKTKSHKMKKMDSDEKTKSYKINKLDSVSEVYLSSTSKQIKLAIAVFLSSNLVDSIRKDLIYAIVSDSDAEKTSDYIMKMFESPQQSVAAVRDYIKSIPTNQSLITKADKYVIYGLIELSELLKDKSYVKLAMEINSTIYITSVKYYLEQKFIHTIVPFEAAITCYLKTSIAAIKHESERMIVYNQFKNEPIEAIKVVISGLPEPKSKNSKSISRVSDKSRVFNPTEEYECYKGSVGYTRDIVSTYYRRGNEIYKILTYNDCLYDVIGRTIETINPNGMVTNTEELFDKVSWSKRLKLLSDYRAKVAIGSVTGAELNDYTGESSDITISWFNDEHRSCSKTYIMKKPKDIKIKMEVE